MQVLNKSEQALAGVCVRTCNADEMSESTAKLGKLWDEFYQTLGPKLSENAKVYGVYTNYESDENGAFDVFACSDVLDDDAFKQVQTQAGQYLVFSKQGDMPAAVIELWGEIWRYFSAQDCPYKRAFLTDFEYYKTPNEIEIYIGIQ